MCLLRDHSHVKRKRKKEQRKTFDTMVPQSAWTCRNLGVFGNAQTKRVQSEFQSGWYSAPISMARDLNMPRSGLTNPDSTKTTPSCRENQLNELMNSINKQCKQSRRGKKKRENHKGSLNCAEFLYYCVEHHNALNNFRWEVSVSDENIDP